MKPWGFEDLEVDSFCKSVPDKDHTIAKREFNNRQPFIEVKGVEPVVGGGEYYYYRWNSDTIHNFRYAMSTDDLSTLSNSELEVWYDFVDFMDRYSSEAPEGFIGATTIDKNGYSHPVREDLSVDTDIFCYEPVRRDPQPIVSDALNLLFMALIDGDVDVIQENLFAMKALECPVITRTLNEPYVDSNPVGAITEFIKTPLVQPTVTSPSRQTVDYHVRTNTGLTGFPDCPPYLSALLDPCNKAEADLIDINEVPTVTSDAGGDISLSFNNDDSNYWWVSGVDGRITVDVTFGEPKFFRWMTITAQEFDFDRVSKDFQLLGYDEHFEVWVPLSRRFQLDTEWESLTAKEFELRGFYFTKIRFIIFDSKACLGANVEFFANRPDVLDGQNQKGEFFCSIDWNLISVNAPARTYHRVNQGYPLCIDNAPSTQFSPNDDYNIIPAMSGYGTNGDYEVSRVENYGSFPLWQLLDKDNDSRAVTNTTGDYVQVEGFEPMNPYKYKIVTDQYQDQILQGWKIYGSTDLLNWVEIESQTSQALATDTEYEYTLPQVDTYYGFRIEYTELGTGGNYGELNTLDLIADLSVEPDPSVPVPIFYKLMSLATDFRWASIHHIHSGYTSGDYPWEAFNGNASNFWEDSQNVDAMIGQYNDKEYVLRRYDLTADSSNPEYMPKDFKIYGSMNGLNWNLLDTQVDQIFTAGEKKHYTIADRANGFRYYRLKADNTNSATATTRIAGLDFFEELGADKPKRRKQVSPTMSSDNENNYESVYSNRYNSNYSGWHAFDESSYNEWVSGSNGYPQWIGYQYNDGTTKHKANLLMMQIRDGYRDERPFLFDIQGTNDGNTWDTLATHIYNDGYEDWNNRWFVYFENDTEYAGYRINIQNSIGNNSTSLASVRFYEIGNGELIENYIDYAIDKHSNLTSSTGTVSTTTNINNDPNVAYYAVDAEIDTNWDSLAGELTGELKYDFGSAIVLDAYSIRGHNSDYYRSPKTWTIEGSNDDSNWDVLDSQDTFIWENGETREWSFDNTTAYRFYRLNISANSGDGTYLGLAYFNIGKIKGQGRNKYYNDSGYHNRTPYRLFNEGWQFHAQFIDGKGNPYSNNHTYQQIFNPLPEREVANREYDFTLKFYEPFALEVYGVKARDGNLTEMLSEWTMQGSNDNVNWDILDSQTGHSWSNLQLKEFTIASPAVYKYYRMVGTDNNGHSTYYGIGKLYLHEKE